MMKVSVSILTSINSLVFYSGYTSYTSYTSFLVEYYSTKITESISLVLAKVLVQLNRKTGVTV